MTNKTEGSPPSLPPFEIQGSWTTVSWKGDRQRHQVKIGDKGELTVQVVAQGAFNRLSNVLRKVVSFGAWKSKEKLAVSETFPVTLVLPESLGINKAKVRQKQRIKLHSALQELRGIVELHQSKFEKARIEYNGDDMSTLDSIIDETVALSAAIKKIEEKIYSKIDAEEKDVPADLDPEVLYDHLKNLKHGFIVMFNTHGELEKNFYQVEKRIKQENVQEIKPDIVIPPREQLVVFADDHFSKAISEKVSSLEQKQIDVIKRILAFEAKDVEYFAGLNQKITDSIDIFQNIKKTIEIQGGLTEEQHREFIELADEAGTRAESQLKELSNLLDDAEAKPKRGS